MAKYSGATALAGAPDSLASSAISRRLKLEPLRDARSNRAPLPRRIARARLHRRGLITTQPLADRVDDLVDHLEPIDLVRERECLRTLGEERTSATPDPAVPRASIRRSYSTAGGSPAFAMSAHSSRRPNTSVATTNARITSPAPAPVSSHSRNAKVMPPTATMASST